MSPLTNLSSLSAGRQRRRESAETVEEVKDLSPRRTDEIFFNESNKEGKSEQISDEMVHGIMEIVKFIRDASKRNIN